MKDVEEEKFVLERKLLKNKVLKDVKNIVHNILKTGESRLYPGVLNQGVLCEGDLLGRHYIVKTNGMHPTAYVRASKEEVDKIMDNEIDMDMVHCGITWNDSFVDGGENYAGWDYAHAGDCILLPIDSQEGKKWTAAEIFDDIINAIMALEGAKDNE